MDADSKNIVNLDLKREKKILNFNDFQKQNIKFDILKLQEAYRQIIKTKKFDDGGGISHFGAISLTRKPGDPDSVKGSKALVGLIYWEDVCRGYVMKECEKYGVLEDDFFNEIKRRTNESKMFAYDLCPNHIFKYKGKTTIIDLEGVYNLNDYQIKNFHLLIEFFLFFLI